MKAAVIINPNSGKKDSKKISRAHSGPAAGRPAGPSPQKSWSIPKNFLKDFLKEC